MELYEIKDHQYYKGLIPSKLPRDFIFCIGSNSTGDHGSVTAELAVKHFEAKMGVVSGRQGQSYGIVTIALKKGFTDPRTGIKYEEHFLTLTQMKVNFKDLYGYARSHPGLTFVIAYTMHARGNPRLGPATTCAATTLLSLPTFLDHAIYEEYPETWCLKITLTGWYIDIPCSRPEDTCCMVCLDKPNPYELFHDLIKVMKI